MAGAQDEAIGAPVPSRFGVLGPLEVVVGGEPVTIRGSRRVALLTRMLLSANQPISAERLAGDIWEDVDVGGAKGLASLVWLLRAQLGEGRIVTRPGGYLFKVQPGELEAADFEGEVASGHDAFGRGDLRRAGDLFDRSLRRWRGPALADVGDASWARVEVARLDELRLGATDALLEIHLALGEHRLVVPAAEAAVSEHPLRERRWASLLLALYRCGRQAEALRAYQRLRNLLHDELGIEPSAALVALEQAIILQRPELDWVPSAPAGPPLDHVGPATTPDRPGPDVAQVPLPVRLAPGPTVGLIGRARELAVLEGALARVTGGGGPEMVLVSGEPGIGKSALAAHLARAAHEAGACVLLGHCDEDIIAPYIPFTEVLTHYVTNAPERLLRDHVDAHGGELGLLVPALRDRLGSLPPPQSTDPETERYLVRGAVTALLAAASALQPVVVVLDDLHWADRPNLRLLRHLMRGHRPLRLLVLATYRDPGSRGSRPLEETLAALHLERGVTRVALSGLTVAELESSLEVMAGHPLTEFGRSFLHRVHRETGGNPFFVIEMLRHLVEGRYIRQDDSGQWVPTATLDDFDVPDSVRQVIASRAARLGSDATRLLAAAAVVGHEFDLDVVARVTELDEEVLLDALEAAGAAALTVEVPGQPGRFQFTHSLVQHALYDQLGTTRQARLHRRAAEVIEATTGDDPAGRAAELARHWLAAGPSASARAATCARLAGDQALAALAPSEAIRWYGLALDALSGSPDLRARARCLAGLGEAQVQIGDPGHHANLAEAARLARQIGDADALVRSALAGRRFFQTHVGRVDHERIGILESALDVLPAGDGAPRVSLLWLLALERLSDGDPEGRLALADEALAMARRLGDPLAVLQARIARRSVELDEDAEELRREIDEITELAATIADPVWRFWSAIRCATDSLKLADGLGLRRCMTEAVAIAAAAGHPALERAVAIHRGWAVLLSGQPEEAERLANDALSRSLDLGQPDATAVYAAQLFYVRLHQGRTGELAEAVARLASSNPGVSAFRSAAALTCLDSGALAEASHLLDAEKATGFATADDWIRPSFLSQWADVAVHLGDTEAAGSLYPLLLPQPARVAFSGGTVHGAHAHALGALATVLGRFDEAERHFVEALDLHQRLDAPFLVARTSLAWARLLVTQGSACDLEHARGLLESAGTLAASHGYAGLSREAALTARQLDTADGLRAAGATAAI